MRRFALFLCLIFAGYLALFSGCKTGYHQEAGKWYWFSWTEAHGTTKKLVTEDLNGFEKLSFLFAKDRENVYYMYKKIEGADPSTFELIGDKYYSKDKDRVYCNEVVVHGADPNSFRILQFPYARDDQNIFNGSIMMQVDEPDEFQVLYGREIQERIIDEDDQIWSKTFAGRRFEKGDHVMYGYGRAKCKNSLYEYYEKTIKFHGSLRLGKKDLKCLETPQTVSDE